METDHRDFELQDPIPETEWSLPSRKLRLFRWWRYCALGPGEQCASTRWLELSVGRFFTDSLTQGSSCQDTR
jgi:hypothetical protein